MQGGKQEVRWCCSVVHGGQATTVDGVGMEQHSMECAVAEYVCVLIAVVSGSSAIRI